LSDADVVCNTANLWSSQIAVFLGMTVHSLQPNNLQCMPATNACKWSKSSHTYDKIVAVIPEVHVHRPRNYCI